MYKYVNKTDKQGYFTRLFQTLNFIYHELDERISQNIICYIIDTGTMYRFFSLFVAYRNISLEKRTESFCVNNDICDKLT